MRTKWVVLHALVGTLICNSATAQPPLRQQDLRGRVAQPAGAQDLHRARIHIVAGPTVQVSREAPTIAHYENLAAGDPVHPGRLVTCSVIGYHEPGRRSGVNCYVSFNGGKSWDLSLKIAEGWQAADPTVVYGQQDDVYVAYIVQRDPDEPQGRVTHNDRWPSGDGSSVVFKSTDGARHWEEVSRFKYTDRPYILTDTTGGRHAGRLYIVGGWGINDISGNLAREGLQIWRSLDGGKSFLGPVTTASPEGTGFVPPGKAAILSDGTLAVLLQRTKSGPLGQELPLSGSNIELHVILSRDGGERFTPSNKITDLRRDSKVVGLPQLAADPGSKAFKDRLYAVFPAIVSDRTQIQFSYSSDQGQTWSTPITVNDDRSPEQAGPDHMLPAIGVNAEGVVLVTWYDRREDTDDIGWRLRAAASLDGGETFSASMPVTDGANAYSPTTPWPLELTRESVGGDPISMNVNVSLNPYFDTNGLAVAADGTFHPTWVDNRTGIQQLWSAALQVAGTAVLHGAPDLADLEDISKSVSLYLSNPSLDRATGSLRVTAQLQNSSNATIESPVKMRVLTLESELGVPEITGADNGERGTGAVWDFSRQLPGGALASMKLSAPRTLTFRISDLPPRVHGRDFKTGVLKLDARVYGKLEKKKADEAAGKDSE